MSANSGSLRINRVDLINRRISAGDLRWKDGVIVAWDEQGAADPALPWLIPGLVDAHVHIESSLLPPAGFARLALRHGTVAAVSDPHEIANVLGVDGVRWMLDNLEGVPFHVLFGAPSCVPATACESAGARLDLAEVEALLDTPGIGYLSEVMNFPGVLAGDTEVLAKVAAARRRGLPVDGHAPGLRGAAAAAYAAAGIGTDHECSELAEAEEKLACGMSILIREGSAARNFAALHPLLSSHPGRVMLCTDDCHPDDLWQGHIDRLVARAVALGHDLFAVLEAASLTPQRHYGLKLGALQVGDPMNAALVTDLEDFAVQATWVDGVEAFAHGEVCLPHLPVLPINRFCAQPVDSEDLVIPAAGVRVRCRVIEAADGQLLTRAAIEEMAVRDGRILADPARDLLLLAVLNRYRPAPPALALIRGFGLKSGALASSVAHDSHNVVAVGCDAVSLAAAIDAVVAARGGLALACADGTVELLPLPIAGLMSDAPGEEVAARYAALNALARTRLGSPLRAPLMSLSFMALLVIPSLKLSDRGLFDGDRFTFAELVCRC
ncbi:adenine deaminase [Rhodocyclus purpureus]|uniref:adenine deaminase n=1 Tax=Rhodocyclus purpureus TaxID=1067 RepID=UPI00191409EB|nr:adenine deaminase [Rhodocyclus purpureus]MBK5913263.1 adenine deaminase [Rhodocyclus purpureus]